MILRACANPNEFDPADDTARVPLNYAALKNDLVETKKLLAEGAYPDGVDETSFTPLMYAAREGHGEIVKLLLEAGADPCRLGYVQRVYPLDFAQWRVNDSKTLELLKGVNAPSVSMEFDTSSLRGAEMIAFVSREYAGIYPIDFKRDVNGEPFSFWLGQTRLEKNDWDNPLFLFSAGLYTYGTPIDIGLILPPEWAVLQEYINTRSLLSFPLDLLQALASRVQQGVGIKHGDIINPSDDDLKDLGWPATVRYLVAVDHSWGSNKDDHDETDVILLTLAPVISKGFKPTNKGGLEMADKLRSARWKKMAIPFYR